jgi:hypothetical protein
LPSAAKSARVWSITCTLSDSAVSSSTASGPTGMPHWMPAFSITGAGMPSASMLAPSVTKVPKVRLV